MIAPPIRKVYPVVICFLLFVLVHLSCSKADNPKLPANALSAKDNYFDAPPGTAISVMAVINKLAHNNEKNPFKDALIKNAGYAQWKFAKIKKGNASSREQGEDEVINIPFVKSGEHSTSAILVITTTSADTVFELMYPQHYIMYGMRDDSIAPDPSTSPDPSTALDPSTSLRTASEFFNVFANFDYDMFGTTDYTVTDGRIFGYDKDDTLHVTVEHTNEQVNSQRINSVTTQNASFITQCNTTKACVTAGSPTKRVSSVQARENCVTTTNCTTIWVGDVGAGNGSGSQTGNNGLPGGGGSGAPTGGNGGNPNGLTNTPCKPVTTGNQKLVNPCNATPWVPDDIVNLIVDPCLKKMVQDAISRDCQNEITTFINTTFANNDKFDLIFRDGTTGTADAKTGCPPAFPDGSFHIVMTLSSNPLSLPIASREYIAITIFHEAIHAWLLAVDTDPNSSEAASHSTMTSEMNINRMANSLREMYPAVSQQDAIDLAWGGLGYTPEWAALSQTEKNRINQTNWDYKHLAKGTPCTP